MITDIAKEKLLNLLHYSEKDRDRLTKELELVNNTIASHQAVIRLIEENEHAATE